jgi:hypothetical protein
MEFKEIVEEIEKKKKETTGFNLMIPIENKKKFEKLCKSKGITVTGALNTFIEISIKEEEKN